MGRFVALAVFTFMWAGSGASQASAPPIVDSLTVVPVVVAPGGVATLTVQAHDPDCADTCTAGCGEYIRADLISWTVDGGTILSTDDGVSASPYTASAQWQAPAVEGTYSISVNLSDSGGFMCGGRASTLTSLPVTVSLSTNQAPVIEGVYSNTGSLFPGESATLSCQAGDPDGDPVTYQWQVDAGEVVAGVDGAAVFTASTPGLATVTCTVQDLEGFSTSDEITLAVSAVEAEKSLVTALRTPQRVAVDSMGDVLVADSGRGGVVVLSLFSGNQIGFIPVPGVLAVDVDWADNLLVGGGAGVQVMDRLGRVIVEIEEGGRDVVDVAVDHVNRRYGVLHRRSGRTVIYDEAGEDVLAFGSSGDGPGQFKTALGLAATSTGGYWSTVHWLVTDLGHGRIQQFDGSGTMVNSFGQAGGGAGEFVAIADVAIGADDTIYVSDSFQSWVQAFNPDGSPREFFGGHGDDLGRFRTALGIAVSDSFDRLVVASVNGGRLQVFITEPAPVANGPEPLAGWSPPSLSFGGVQIGSSSSLSTVLANSGEAPLGLGAITVEGAYLADHDCPGLLDPGVACTFTLTFAPEQAGLNAGALVVATSAGEERVPLTGDGALPPSLTLQPETIVFGDQVVGTTSAPQLVSLANQGPGPLSVYGIQVTGAFVHTTQCGAVVAAGEACTISVSFSPVSAGDLLTGALTVNSDALGAPHQVTLQGRAVAADIFMTVGDVAISESSPEALFPVSLSRVSDGSVSVDYVTIPDTALAGADFTAVSGTLVVPEGMAQATVAVPILDDGILEPAMESFRLQLTNPVNAILTDDIAVAEILDDEICPGPNLLYNPGAEVSGESEGLPGWTAVDGIWLQGVPDPAPVEGAYYFSADGSDLAQVEQIVDLSRFDAHLVSGSLTVEFRGFLRTATEGSADTARIRVEYLHAVSGMVLEVFDTGEILSPLGWQEVADVRVAPADAGWIRIQLIARRVDGSLNEAIFDALELRTHRVATVSVGDMDVIEGAAGTTSELIFPVTLSCAAGDAISVDFSTRDATAVEGEDYTYTAGTLVLPSDSVSTSITVQVFGDDQNEDHEIVWLDLGDVSPAEAATGQQRGVGVILNDDACAEKAAYWSKHVWLWPIPELEMGGVTYGQEAVLDLLGYTGSDASSMVARELAAALLNVAAGAPQDILPTMMEADAYLVANPPGSQPGGAAKNLGRDLTTALNAYNTRKCN